MQILSGSKPINKQNDEKGKQSSDLIARKTKKLSEIQNELFLSGVMGPILEEVIFRAILQPLCEKGIIYIIPIAAEIFVYGSLHVAALSAIFMTSIIFGLVHLTNGHSSLVGQAFFATSGGIVYGFLAR